MSIEECSSDLSYSYIEIIPRTGRFLRPDQSLIIRHEFTMDGKEHLLHAEGYDLEVSRNDQYESVSYQDRYGPLNGLRRVMFTSHVRGWENLQKEVKE